MGASVFPREIFPNIRSYCVSKRAPRSRLLSAADGRPPGDARQPVADRRSAGGRRRRRQRGRPPPQRVRPSARRRLARRRVQGRPLAADCHRTAALADCPRRQTQLQRWVIHGRVDKLNSNGESYTSASTNSTPTVSHTRPRRQTQLQQWVIHVRVDKLNSNSESYTSASTNSTPTVSHTRPRRQTQLQRWVIHGRVDKLNSNGESYMSASTNSTPTVSHTCPRRQTQLQCWVIHGRVDKLNLKGETFTSALTNSTLIKFANYQPICVENTTLALSQVHALLIICVDKLNWHNVIHFFTEDDPLDLAVMGEPVWVFLHHSVLARIEQFFSLASIIFVILRYFTEYLLQRTWCVRGVLSVVRRHGPALRGGCPRNAEERDPEANLLQAGHQTPGALWRVAHQGGTQTHSCRLLLKPVYSAYVSLVFSITKHSRVLFLIWHAFATTIYYNARTVYHMFSIL